MKLDSATSRSLDRLGNEFLVATLRIEADRRDNIPALFELGAVLTKLRRYEEGLEIDQRLVLLEPSEPILRYNLACSLSLLERTEEALDELTRAIELGYRDVKHMLRDRDLKPLRTHARFGALVKKLQGS